MNPLLQAILGFARVPGSNAQPYITCVGTFIGIHQNLAIIIPQIVTGISLYRFLTGQQKTSSIEPGHSGDEGNDIASSIPIIMNTHDSGSHRHSDSDHESPTNGDDIRISMGEVIHYSYLTDP